jgi:hypothetical protein
MVMKTIIFILIALTVPLAIGSAGEGKYYWSGGKKINLKEDPTSLVLINKPEKSFIVRIF